MRKLLTLVLLSFLIIPMSWCQESADQSNNYSPARIQAFCDGLLSGLMSEHQIPGAVLVVVREDETLYSQGFGYSDLQEKTKVDPDSSLFRIGSISKVFIWTAVMQLYQKGILDLNADINQYLGDFSLKKKDGQRITLKNLMSHSAGFEDRVLGVFGEDEKTLLPLGELLSKEMPAQVRPPNSHVSYSNHGSALAALIVEKVSGVDFHTYVEENILSPLGMDQSTFKQPVPERLQPFLANGYSSTSDPNPKPFEYIRVSPAGAVSSSGSDMAKLMKAFLGEGNFNGVSILDTTTFREMVQPAFTQHTSINPMLHGLLDLSRNQYRVYGHFGDTFWFHSMMVLIPEEKMGIYLSLNGAKGGLTYLSFFEQFMNAFFPENEPLPIQEIDLSDGYFDPLAGDYKMNRYSRSDLTKIMSLFLRFKVEKESNQYLRIESPFGSFLYEPRDSLVFRKQGGSDQIAFGKNDQGKISYLYADLMPMLALEKAPWYESQSLHLSIFLISLLANFFILWFWPMVFLSRRRFYPTDPNRRYLPLSSKFLAWVNALLFLIFVIGLSVILSDPFSVAVVIPNSLKVLLILPILFSAISLMMFIHSLKIFEISAITWRTKIFYFLLVIINLSVVLQMFYWNLLGWQY
jgi:CubicO group peptidase (beta-lactamase class C family)